MPRQDFGVVWQAEEFVLDAVQLILITSSGQIGAPNALLEESVATEEQSGFGDMEGRRTRRMTGCVDEANGSCAEK